MYKKLIIFLSTIGLILAIETPTYKLLEKKGNIEIRLYAPMVIAKTLVEEDYDSALSQGFRRIANYIFGGNEKDMSISMTAPVISKKSISNPGLYEVLFVMPKKYSLEDLPKPNLTNVSLEKKNLGKVICIKFGGWATEKKVERFQNDLIESISERGLETKGDFLVAQYNSPLAIPPFRKNEILIQIK
jgi:hypothetical protein